jgi:excinuclease UvrABC nuclease subunit
MGVHELFDGCICVEPFIQDLQVLAGVPTCKGIVLFTNEEDRPIQLLTGANIRRLVKCRLFGSVRETSKKRTDISEITRKVYHRCCYNDFSAGYEYWLVSRKLWPDTYRKLNPFGKISYVKIDMSIQWPRFELTDKPFFSDKKKVFGPFPSKKSANAFIVILQEVFGLCRMGQLIEGGEKAASCPYLQMGHCSGPCDGRVNQSNYMQQIEQAVSAASGDKSHAKTMLENQMSQLCEQMEFEQAQLIKKRLEKLEQLNRSMYRWTRELTKLAILHIDKSARITEGKKRKKTQTFSAFLIRGGHITRLKDFTLQSIDDFHKALLSQLHLDVAGLEPELLYDELVLVGYYLYRSKRSGIWIDCSKERDSVSLEQIRNAICENFGHEEPIKDAANQDAV